MAIEHGWLVKGFVLAHNPPAQVIDAMESLLAEIWGGSEERKHLLDQ